MKKKTSKHLERKTQNKFRSPYQIKAKYYERENRPNLPIKVRGLMFLWLKGRSVPPRLLMDVYASHPEYFEERKIIRISK